MQVISYYKLRNIKRDVELLERVRNPTKRPHDVIRGIFLKDNESPKCEKEKMINSKLLLHYEMNWKWNNIQPALNPKKAHSSIRGVACNRVIWWLMRKWFTRWFPKPVFFYSIGGVTFNTTKMSTRSGWDCVNLILYFFY